MCIVQGVSYDILQFHNIKSLQFRAWLSRKSQNEFERRQLFCVKSDSLKENERIKTSSKSIEIINPHPEEDLN